jgi:hypothetical protein
MENTFFLHQIKHTNGTFEKGIVVKTDGTSRENFEAVKQSYHAYLGAYAYGHDEKTDFVSCFITDLSGNLIAPFSETWNNISE